MKHFYIAILVLMTFVLPACSGGDEAVTDPAEGPSETVEATEYTELSVLTVEDALQSMPAVFDITKDEYGVIAVSKRGLARFDFYEYEGEIIAVELATSTKIAGNEEASTENSGIVAQFLYNAFPGNEDAAVDWLVGFLQSIEQGVASSDQTVFGNKLLEAEVDEDMVMKFTVSWNAV